MAEQLIQFRTWRILCDPEVNQRIYEQIVIGAPEECACDDCAHFVARRDSFYPTEIRQLLKQIGIDYRKEAEIYKLGGDEHPVAGWYNFAGRIESGENDMQYLDSDFQLELATGGGLVQEPFGEVPLARLEWQSATKDPRTQ